MTPDESGRPPADRVVFVVPEGLDRPTGGNRYDQRLAAALSGLGTEVQLRPAPGRWPDAAPADRARLSRLLRADVPVLVDGLLGCAAPDEIGAATGADVAVHLLVHMPLGLDPGLTPDVAENRNCLEGKALRAATGVLATSPWTAADLRRRHGRAEVTVAVPGIEPADPATGSSPPLLRQLATVSTVKDQLTVVAALALHAGRGGPDWAAELTGALDVEPDYTSRVRAAIAATGLSGRVRLTGPLTGAALARAWCGTDLLLLPSRAETWGMVVGEALARGIPAVVGTGTGAELALGRAPDGATPGAVVTPGSAADLATAIEDLLGEGRERSRRAALARRADLPSWRATAATVLAALHGGGR